MNEPPYDLPPPLTEKERHPTYKGLGLKLDKQIKITN